MSGELGLGFDPRSNSGGINVIGRGIAVDAGVFGKIEGFDAWNKANLSTRVDAVIAHELTEALRKSHRAALKHAPKTSLRISDKAREVLKEMRRIKLGL